MGVITEENQRNHVNQIKRELADVVWLELKEVLSEKKLVTKIKNIDQLDNTEFKRFVNVVNKKSVKNIINELIISSQETIQLSLNRITHEDSESILNLSNEVEVRLNSFNQGMIDSKSHLNWMKSVLQDENLEVFTFKLANIHLVAYVKFEKKESSVIIGIALSKEFRGKKLASLIIYKAIREYLKNHNEVKIIAEIKSNNLKSIKAFKKIGFEILKKNSDIVTLVY
jgi:RimJ/RimL family protein N-acetyltransferase